MVLNVVDEIIDGQPKYNITTNSDGTNNIELANYIIQQGTTLNKSVFNKIENVLSYQDLEFEDDTTTITGTYSGNVIATDITPTWSSRTNLGNKVIMNATTYDDISPVITYSAINGSFGTEIKNIYGDNNNDYSESVNNTYITIGPRTGSGSGSSAFLNNEQRTAYGSYNRNAFSFYPGQELKLIKHYDMKQPSKLTFNYRIELTHVSASQDAIVILGSNNNQDWTQLHSSNTTNSSFESMQYYRYYKVEITAKQQTSGAAVTTPYIWIFYLYVNNIKYIKTSIERNFALPVNTFVNNQRVLFNSSNDNTNVINNTLNNILIDTIMQKDKFYELIYNSSLNKFIAEEVRV